MSKARATASVVLVLILVGALGLALWWSLTQLQKEVTAALVTAVGAVVVLVLSRYFEQRRAADAQVREKTAAIYDEFISFWIELLMFRKDAGGTGESDPTSAEMMRVMSSFTKGALIYSSDEVVRTWSRYRRRFFRSNPPPEPDPNLDPAALLDFETVLLSIRKEFGHGNRNLQRGDLMGLFINDVDVLLIAEQSGAT